MVAWESYSRKASSLEMRTPIIFPDRKSMPLWEAASLLSGVEATRDLTGEGASLMHQMKFRLVADKYGSSFKKIKFPPEVLASQIDLMPDSTEIDRTTLKAFAASKGLEIKGLTDDN